MKFAYTTLLLILLPTILLARIKSKNTVAVSAEFSYMPGLFIGEKYSTLIPVYKANSGDQFAFSYDRNIKERWRAGFTFLKSNDGDFGVMRHERWVPLEVGSISFGGRRRMLDVQASYNFVTSMHHSLWLGGALSLKRRMAVRITDVDSVEYTNYNGGTSYYLDPSIDEVVVYNPGLAAMATYNYTLFKDRAGIGCSFKWRAYLNEFYTHFTSGLYLRFNF